jgi:hypothetical protein
VHRKRHFNLQVGASALYRKILEDRAEAATFDEGVISLVTPRVYLEVMVAKAFGGLTDETAEVTIDQGIAASRELSRLVAHDDDTAAPGLQLDWRRRGGEFSDKGRCAELQKLAEARLAALTQTAKNAIRAATLGIEEQLILGGLESSEAKAVFGAMPTVEALMPSLSIEDLGGEALAAARGRGRAAHHR